MSLEEKTKAVGAISIPQDFSECIGLPAERFLYHGAPMALMDRILEVDLDSARCSCIVGPENPFFIAGLGVPSWVGIEFMAQCIAVMGGARAVISDQPLPVGLLLGTTAYRSNVVAFDPDTVYEASCNTQVRDAHGLGAFDCKIDANGELVAQARLTVKELEGGTIHA
jgi:predicted hotdog family 3-hydroxylacyl-ACP dehydratase